MKVELDSKNFSYFVFCPKSEKLSKSDQKIALIGTILLSFSLGIGHAVCAIIYGVKACKIASKVSDVGQEELKTKKISSEKEISSESHQVVVPESSSSDEIPEIMKVPIDDAINEIETTIHNCFNEFINKDKAKNLRGIFVKVAFGTEDHSAVQFGAMENWQDIVKRILDETYDRLNHLSGAQYYMEVKIWGKQLAELKSIETCMSKNENEIPIVGNYIKKRHILKPIELSTLRSK